MSFQSNNKIRIKKYLRFPKSLYINVKYFGFKDGLKFPFLLNHKVILRKFKRKVKI